MLSPALLDGAGSLDTDTQAWIRTLGVANVSYLQGRRTDKLIRTLKSGPNVWNTLDRLWLFAAENSQQALLDLKAMATATLVNAPAFTASRGYKGNGSNAYINTGFDPSTAANYSQNDACEGVWIETPQTSSASAHTYLSYNESVYTYIAQANTTVYGWGVNNATAGTGYTFVTEIGSWHTQRTGAGALALYRDGSQVQTSTLGSTAVASRNFFALAGNSAGAPYQPTDGRLAAAWMGKSLASPATFHATLRAYMTAQGVA